MIKKFNVFSRKKFVVLMKPIIAKMMISMTEKILNHTNVQNLIHSDEKFDIVVVEEFMNQAHKAFATHFGGHLVLLSTMGASIWISNNVGNPTPISYVPDPILGYSSHMTFVERLQNTLSYIMAQSFDRLYVNPKQNELIKKYFPNGPDLNDVMYNASIVLLNSHQSINQPVPYVPNMIDIGGFHVAKPKKLPNDLQKFLDNAKNGVVYFSLGSHLKSALMPVEKRQMILNAFSKLKEQVLWKWEEDDLPGKPENVHTQKWVPQQDVLGIFFV